MKRCPITYEIISDNELYSQKGLSLLAPNLKNLHPLNLTAQEQLEEAAARIGKMSIQGIQPKLVAILNTSKETFEIVDQHGIFILKPQNNFYPELPENEAITMTLASLVGIDVPIHGLIYSKDNSKTYFIKRFDRIGKTEKLAVEDFTQLSNMSRDTKYDSSMEKVVKIIFNFCSFPKIEAQKLFKLTLFNFLIGNEDMHLKNFSLIANKNITSLSPAYDLLNTTIAQKNTQEELAIPLNGRKNNLRKKDFYEYLAKELLELNDTIIDNVIIEFKKATPIFKKYISYSFLSSEMQEKYLAILKERCKILDL